MATICFRPPPLPPSKKSTATFNGIGRHRKSNNNLMSSTYMSFRDPAEDEPAVVEQIELDDMKERRQRKCRKNVTMNSDVCKDVKGTLIRSHSEGNLKKGSATPISINKYIRVLSGSWKNLLGLGGMSRPPKPAATAKNVPPPVVPQEFRLSGSSFGSAGYASADDNGFLAPSDQPGIPRDDHSDYGSTVSSSTGKSPGPIYPGPQFTFPCQPLTHKAAVFYHHQLSLQEDQGIDMTQSPGRDSPGSSSGSAGSGSRHSTASLDSGRASYHPLSTAGRSTIGSSNSPRCSLSSCSIGSDQSRIERMINQGLPDHEIIHTWLTDLQYEEYYPLFMSAGYDLPTIGRMTPEDLTAIGIKIPNHRKRLKTEIGQLNLPDNLPDFIPCSLEAWLQFLRLEEYLPAFLAQGYQTIDQVAQLTWEDLEEFGMVKLGHQKKIMLAIKRIKDIKNGKRINSDTNRIYATQDVMVHASSLGPPSPGVPQVHSTFRSFHQPWEIDQTRLLTAANTGHYVQPFFCTDIVPIQIRTGRGKSLESLEDATERTHHTFNVDHSHAFYHQQPPIGWRTRSYDDGDITPTNETTIFYEGGGTLPRPRGIIRPRQIVRVAGKTRDSFPDFEKPQFNLDNYGNPQYPKLPKDVLDANKYHVQFSPMMGKKIPPHPPKRQDLESNEQTTTVEIHQTSSPLPLPAYPSSDSLSISLDNQGDLPLPPPPAPGTPPRSLQSQLNSSQSWSSEEQELIKALALQHRNGSDASFKSSSSTESDSMPFANENAGTIRTRPGGGRASDYSPVKSRTGLPPHPSPTTNRQSSARSQTSEPTDVLNDIGNMLANLTVELDAMLEEEKRQQ